VLLVLLLEGTLGHCELLLLKLNLFLNFNFFFTGQTSRTWMSLEIRTLFVMDIILVCNLLLLLFFSFLLSLLLDLFAKNCLLGVLLD
jgi:hypothetical protein